MKGNITLGARENCRVDAVEKKILHWGISERELYSIKEGRYEKEEKDAENALCVELHVVYECVKWLIS